MFMLLMYEVVTNINNLLALASVPGPCLQYNIYSVHIFQANINKPTIVYFPMLSTFLCTHTSRPMNVFDLCVYPGRCCGSMHYYWKRNHWKYTVDPPLHILVLQFSQGKEAGYACNPCVGAKMSLLVNENSARMIAEQQLQYMGTWFILQGCILKGASSGRQSTQRYICCRKSHRQKGLAR